MHTLAALLHPALSVFCMFSSPPADFFCGWVDGLTFSVWQRWSKVGEADNAKMSLPVWMGVWPWEGS